MIKNRKKNFHSSQDFSGSGTDGIFLACSDIAKPTHSRFDADFTLQASGPKILVFWFQIRNFYLKPKKAYFYYQIKGKQRKIDQTYVF